MTYRLGFVQQRIEADIRIMYWHKLDGQKHKRWHHGQDRLVMRIIAAHQVFVMKWFTINLIKMTLSIT
jgi:hypothetical protein